MNTLGLRYKQKGKARLKSKQYYRSHKQQLRRKSKQWRRRHRTQVKKYRQRKKRQPSMHRLRPASRVAAAPEYQDIPLGEEIAFVNPQTDQVGTLVLIDADDAEVDAEINGLPVSFNLYDFMEWAAIVDKEDQERLLGVLDAIHESAPDVDTPDVVAARYLAKTAVIRKEDGKFCVRSPDNPDWSGGCYDTEEEAKERLQQVEFFKHKKAYSYDRTKTATGSWFHNFKAVPRIAMVGNSFEPLTLTIDKTGVDRFQLKVSTRGHTKGNVQHCSDTLRFLANDVDEKATMFFRLGLSPHKHRIFAISEALIDTTNGVEVSCTADFSMEETGDLPTIFKDAMRPLSLSTLVLNI